MTPAAPQTLKLAFSKNTLEMCLNSLSRSNNNKPLPVAVSEIANQIFSLQERLKMAVSITATCTVAEIIVSHYPEQILAQTLLLYPIAVGALITYCCLSDLSLLVPMLQRNINAHFFSENLIEHKSRNPKKLGFF